MANYSRWDDIKKQRPAVGTETRTGIEQDLAPGQLIYDLRTEASLTQRERQVMQGLVTGQSNKTIAREYDISPRTVEVYRANVMTKMQAGNLSELVRFAIRAGIVED